jgi:hypothetical protein
MSLRDFRMRLRSRCGVLYMEFWVDGWMAFAGVWEGISIWLLADFRISARSEKSALRDG